MITVETDYRIFLKTFIAFSVFLFAVPALLNAAPSLEQGYVSKSKARKGIVLHLHGCSGLHSKGWIREWFRHFERSGYRVYAPDSFADERPAKSCAPPWPKKSKIIQLRMRQADNALKILRKRYKNKKIYVWGHSEGAQLLNRLAIKVSGALTTGYGCGYGRKAKIWLPSDVPLLALGGNPEHDHFLRAEVEFKRAESIETLCDALMPNRLWRWKSFNEYGHIIPIWDRNVRTAVNTIIPIRMSAIAANSSPRNLDASRYRLKKQAKKAFNGKYLGKADDTAFAIGPDGSYGYSDSMANMADAVTIALYWCNKFSRKSKKSNNCAVYAVNDIVLGSKPPGKTVKMVQQKLLELQFLDGVIDGKWGRASAGAYALFRSQVGLSKNTAIDVDALRALGLTQ